MNNFLFKNEGSKLVLLSFIFLFSFLFLIPLVNAGSFGYALESLGTFKQGQTINLCQICSDATYITYSVKYPNSTIVIQNDNLTSEGSGLFCKEFNSTQLLGRHDFIGTSDGCEGEFTTYFEVTPTGVTNDRIYYGVLVFFMCIFAFVLIYLGFKEPWKYFYNLIGGMLLALSGIFLWLIVLAGIDEPLLRMGVSWILIGVGAFFIFKETSKLTKLTSEEEEEDEWDT